VIVNPEQQQGEPTPPHPTPAWEKVKELFSQAVDLPVEERPAFLERQCGGDATLRKQLDELLESEALFGNFLGGDSVRQNTDTAFERATAPVPGQGIAERIGRYRLLKIIGEGGFGTVYLAEQEEPIFRRVAVKIIKPGMDTRTVIARFEAERQALAMMDHPNIARVIDAGETDRGRPYFVMEWVNGIPITKYCDEHRLPASERIRLFMTICQAVQHAHQKGIIHRDLKPSNVLVTQREGQPIAKVIDFGIAKATQARLTEKTLFTEAGHMIGTPQYMSPEQAETSIIDIDTRSDIYSLGVVLYELLTGTTPLDPRELQRLAYTEMQRIIRDVDPPIPSARVSALARSDSKIASQRSTEFSRLHRLIRGDLDWVVMKCLEKDRGRRYETASALADDLRRQLSEEPVEASPPSRTYRIRKFARKHRVPFQIGMLIVVLLVAATAISLWQARRADIARAASIKSEREMELDRDRVVAERQRADEQAALATAVNDFMDNDLFEQSDDLTAPFAQINLKDSLDHASERLESQRIDRPMVDAAIRFKLGQLYRNMGVFDKAIVQLQAAAASRRKVPGSANPQLPAILYWLAETETAANQFEDALAVIKEDFALEAQTDTQGRQTYAILCLRGFVQQRQKNFAAAAATYQEALDDLKRAGSKTLPQQCDVFFQISNMLMAAGDVPKAILALQQAIAVTDQINPTDYNVLYYRLQLARRLNSQGRYQEALPIWRALGDFALTHSGSASTTDPVEEETTYAPFREYARAHQAEPLPRAFRGVEVYWGVIMCCQGMNLENEVRVWQQRLISAQDNAIEQSRQSRQPPQAQASLETQYAYTNMWIGLFSEAEKHCEAVSAVSPADNRMRLNLVSLRAFLQHKAGYITGCREARAQIKTMSDPFLENGVSRLSVLMDLPDVDRKAAADLENAGWKAHSNFPDRQLTHGIFLYRHGDYDESIRCLTKARNYFEKLIANTPDIPNAQGRYMAREDRISINFFLAMAEQRRGKNADSRRLLEIARSQLKAIPSSVDVDAMDDMRNWILMKIAAREADALFAGTSAPATTEASVTQ
jgi:serine/threonine protein kinase/tetratricopeptide (TPR) repeat protein